MIEAIDGPSHAPMGLLELPESVVVHIWSHCCPDARQSLWQTCRYFRENGPIVSTVALLANQACQKDGIHLPSPSLRPQGLKRIRFAMRMDLIPRTHIERFYKHSSSLWLKYMLQALSSDLAARQWLCTVRDVELQAWDLEDPDAESTASLITQLFPAARCVDVSTCLITHPAFLRALDTAAAARTPAPAHQFSMWIRNSASAKGLTVRLPVGSSLLSLEGTCGALSLELPPCPASAPVKVGSPPRWAISPGRARPSANSTWPVASQA